MQMTTLILKKNLQGSLHRIHCRYFSKFNFPKIRSAKKDEIAKIVEVQQRQLFLEELQNIGNATSTKPHYLNPSEIDEKLQEFESSTLTAKKLKDIIDASLSTFLLHVESRVASSQGLGFYTIGPCGEELLNALGSNIRSTDPVALHYRHVAVSIARQMGAGQESTGIARIDYLFSRDDNISTGRELEDIIMDRARGYVCSTLDPVTGGRHCAIGGSDYDFYVTSTLASQAPPGVGRALAIPLASRLLSKKVFPKDGVSVVTLGEGSTNNAHFLAALNLAEYSVYMKLKCPLVFVITDNQTCISLQDNGWINKGATSNVNMKRIDCNGNDVLDVYRCSEEAMCYARKVGRPVLLFVQQLNRRFGHAATDRQSAYITNEEIERRAHFNNIFPALQVANAAGVMSAQEILEKYKHIWHRVEVAFDKAVNEPKITDRGAVIATNCADAPRDVKSVLKTNYGGAFEAAEHYSGVGIKKLDKPQLKSKKKGYLDNMRKHMTRFFDEVLTGGEECPYLCPETSVVYLGEDVRHGGYYLVTDGLYKKHPLKVHDFPPDETTLLGAGQGFSQAGLLPIVEIPYAKYLDCGADMFYEIALTHWVTNTKQKHGMIMRLQGFDKGKFGGNFHTHNELAIPVGLDVVCYSNGSDYVRGMRYCLQAAEAGRIVMTVDCTDLLNRRHLGVHDDHVLTTGKDKDDHWLTLYPSTGQDDACLSFNDVIYYSGDWDSDKSNVGARLLTSGKGKPSMVDGAGKVLIISYGNGLPTSLQAMKQLITAGVIGEDKICVVDCPYLSSPPQALVDLLTGPEGKKSPFEHVIFADICKEKAGMPFAGFAVDLQKRKLLPPSWRVVGAQNTYNPLGKILTFLSIEDVVSSVYDLIDK